MDGIVPIQQTIQVMQRTLINAIVQNDNGNREVAALMRISCPIQYKYLLLDTKYLILNNSQTVEDLKTVVVALAILEKYGRHLLKPEESRSNMWRYIKFSNQIFKERVDCINGGRDVMKLLGYTENIGDGLSFPEGGNTNPDQLIRLVADIVLARRELDSFLKGQHPAPEIIEELLPARTKGQVRQLHQLIRQKSGQNIQQGTDTSRPQQNPVAHTPTLLQQLKESAQEMNTPRSSTYITESSQRPHYDPEQYQGSLPPGIRNVGVPSSDATQNINHQAQPHQLTSSNDQVFYRPHLIENQRYGIPDTSSHQIAGLPDNVYPVPVTSQLSNVPVFVQDLEKSVEIPKQEVHSTAEKPQSAEEVETSIVCDICGDSTAMVVCSVCDNKQLCKNCDQKWHHHPKRKNHQRKTISNLEEEVFVTANFSQPPTTGVTVGLEKISSPASISQQSLGGESGHQRPTMEGVSMSQQVYGNNYLPHVAQGNQNTVQRPVIIPGQQYQSMLQNQGHSAQNPNHMYQSMPQQAFSAVKTAPGGPPTSKLLPAILNIKDLQKRKSKLEINILTLQEEIEDTEKQILNIIATNPAFYEDEKHITLVKRKGMLLREKMDMEKYLADLEQMSEGDNGPVDVSKQQIYYPPGTPMRLGSNESSGSLSSSPQLYPYGSFSLVQTPQGYIMEPVFQSTRTSPSISSSQQQQSFQGGLLQSQGQTFTQLPHHQSSQGQNASVNDNQSSAVRQQFTGQPAYTNPPDVLRVQNTDKYQDQTKQMNEKKPVKTAENKDRFKLPSYVMDPAEKLALSENYLNESLLNRSQEQDISSQPIFYPPNLLESKEKRDVQNVSPIKSKFPAGVSESATLPPQRPDRITKQSAKGDIAWVCQHCTFHNTTVTKVCQVCSKTTSNPTYIQSDTVMEDQNENSTQCQHKEDPEETQVLQEASLVGQRITQAVDQIHQEKVEAQRRFQQEEKERLVKERLEKERLEKERLEKERLEKERLENEKKVQLEKERMKRIEKMSLQTKATEYVEVADKRPIPVSEDQETKNTPKAVPKPTPRLSPFNPEPSPPSSMGSDGSGTFLAPGPKTFAEKMEAIRLKKEQQQLAIDGKTVVQWMKTAELEGFAFEELQIALNLVNDNESPLDWLRNKWSDIVETVCSMADQKGTQAENNKVGKISSQEAQKALIQEQGNVHTAVKSCVDRRTEMFNNLSKEGDFSREAILEALYRSKGDEEEAKEDLFSEGVQSFRERIWENDHTQTEEVVEGAARALAIHEACNSITNSILGYEKFQIMIKNTEIDLNRRIRMIFVEGRLQSWGRAETVIKILDFEIANGTLDATLEEVVEAVKNCGDRQSSLAYLQQECDCCYTCFPMSKIRNLGCKCKICFNCVKGYFEYNIRERHVRNLGCPMCGFPDMENTEAAADYLTFLAMLLQTMVSQEIQDLYQMKLRDWHLQQDENFRWCAHCGNGFIWDRGERDLGMRCTFCNKMTCFRCKKEWEDQHVNLTCEEFEQWKIDNDPGNQALGLARHLETNGIDCPSCKMRYALAKGGCMHFKCPQCGHEFCSGCSQGFVTEGPCAGYKHCHGRGLHCHHPRDCFYYLRDNDVEELQKVLRDKKLAFDTDPPAAQEDVDHCGVMEQKEIADGKMDEPCGKDVQEGQAGLCVLHYKEYLVGIINKHKADPVNILSVDQMKRLLEREEKNVPQVRLGERESQYRKRLVQYIKEKVPIRRRR